MTKRRFRADEWHYKTNRLLIIDGYVVHSLKLIDSHAERARTDDGGCGRVS